MSTAMVSLHLIRDVMGAIKKILRLEICLVYAYFLTSELKYALRL